MRRTRLTTLLAALIAFAQIALAHHALAHADGVAQGAACFTCLAADSLDSGAVNSPPCALHAAAATPDVNPPAITVRLTRTWRVPPRAPPAAS